MGSLRVSENSSPAITNCTIIGSIGNGFVCDGETCAPVLRNCIFLYNNPMDFSVVSGNPEIHFSITEDEWTGTGVQNTIEKPIYVPGPPNMYYLSSGYYLSHQAAQQTYDSPGIDQGSGPADSICFQTPAGEECLGEYTTRSDLKSDTGVVDIGYHPPTKQWVPIETYVSIDKLIKMLKPGFECAIYTRVYNADEETLTDYPLFVILEIAGTYFFAPSFGDYDSYNREFVTGTSTVEVLPPFEWPEGAGNFDSAFVYAALVLPDISDLYGDMDVLEFGWSEE